MARNKGFLASMGGLAIDLLIAGIELPLKFMEASEKAHMDEIKMKRTQNLIQNTDHMMRSREIMNRRRLQQIESQELDNELKRERLEELKARTRLMNARTNMLNAVSPASNPDAEFDGAVVNACKDCGSYQSRDLGDTCSTCGGRNLTPQHLEVRN